MRRPPVNTGQTAYMYMVKPYGYKRSKVNHILQRNGQFGILHLSVYTFVYWLKCKVG